MDPKGRYLYLHTTNSDLTEGRGWPEPVAFYDHLGDAASAWRRSGVQGTESGAAVHQVALDRDATVRGAGQPRLLRDAVTVIGEHRSALGLDRGLIPATLVDPWPADKQRRFRQLAEQFPDVQPPEPGPSLASTLPTPLPGAVDEVFLLMMVEVRSIGSAFPQTTLAPVSVHSTLRGGTRAAARLRAAVPYVAPVERAPSDQRLLRVVRARVGAPIGSLRPDAAAVVWAESKTDVNERTAADLAEYRALLAELAGQA